MNKSDEVMTIQEVADYLKLHYQTVYDKVVKTKEIPASKIGRRWRVQKKDVIAYLERQKGS